MSIVNSSSINLNFLTFSIKDKVLFKFCKKISISFLFSLLSVTINANEKDLSDEIEKINKNLTKIEKIKKFFVIKENFSIENGMMTPTLKLKRYKIINIYKKNFE